MRGLHMGKTMQRGLLVSEGWQRGTLYTRLGSYPGSRIVCLWRTTLPPLCRCQAANHDGTQAPKAATCLGGWAEGTGVDRRVSLDLALPPALVPALLATGALGDAEQGRVGWLL